MSAYAKRGLRPLQLTLIFLTVLLCALLTVACIISYSDGSVSTIYSHSPVPEIGDTLYVAGMGYVTSIKSDVFTRDVLYALEKGDGSYSALANSYTEKILALKNDSLSAQEVTFVETVYLVCKAEYTARKTEHLAGLFLTGFLHKEAAETDRANSDKIYDMLCGAKTMADVERAHDFGMKFLDMSRLE